MPPTNWKAALTAVESLCLLNHQSCSRNNTSASPGKVKVGLQIVLNQPMITLWMDCAAVLQCR